MSCLCPPSPAQAAGLQPPARCFAPSAGPAPALSLCPPLAPHLALRAFGLGEPLCVDYCPPDATLPLLRAWLCSGGDRDHPRRPVTHRVHAGDPHSPAIVHFRGTRLPRSAGPLREGHPEPAAASLPAALRECVRLLLDFPPLRWYLVFVLCLLRGLLISSSSSSVESSVSAPVFSHI